MQTPANFDLPQGVVWYPSEIQAHIQHLTLAQAQKVLAQAVVKHDAMIGLNWDVFNTLANEMFPGNIERFVEIIETSQMILVATQDKNKSPDDIDLNLEEVITCFTVNCGRNSQGGYRLLGTNEQGASCDLELPYSLLSHFGITDRGRVVVGNYVLILMGEVGVLA